MSQRVTKLEGIGDVDECDILIIIIGYSGVGRSAFINSAVENEILTVRQSNESQTSEVQYVRCLVKVDDNEIKRVVFAEVPLPELISSDELRNWVEELFTRKIKISGIFYLHHITNEEISLAPLELLEKLCKETTLNFPRHVAIVATVWDEQIAGPVVELRVNELQRVWREQTWAKLTPVPRVLRFDPRRRGMAMDMVSSLMTSVETGGESARGAKGAVPLTIARQRDEKKAIGYRHPVLRDGLERRIWKAREVMEMREELEQEAKEARERQMMMVDKLRTMERELSSTAIELNTTKDKLGSTEDELVELKVEATEQKSRIRAALVHEENMWDERIHEVCERVKAEVTIEANKAIWQLERKHSVNKREAIDQAFKSRYNQDSTIAPVIRYRMDWEKKTRKAIEVEERKWKNREEGEIERVKNEWILKKQEALKTLEGILIGHS